ncbi:mitotic spindle assembly checkpoint protein MAD2A-like [Bacillus rossius redtenbacheri]|uniref:mitotic spindle assembly checkpoint protein MAD2A-like n=1 Tax=Bacillus rossius redtenbacheri TaxID=93214 RepID=UPI002FDD5887
MNDTNILNIEGSVDVLIEYLNYAVNTLLYHREVYSSEKFAPLDKYGLQVYMITDEKIKSYVDTFLREIKEFIDKKKVEVVDINFISEETLETVESWSLTIKYINRPDDDKQQKPLSKIRAEIANVFRQIIATVSYIPHLEQPVTFNITAGTLLTKVPSKWEETVMRKSANLEHFPLRDISTNYHEVKISVAHSPTGDQEMLCGD